MSAFTFPLEGAADADSFRPRKAYEAERTGGPPSNPISLGSANIKNLCSSWGDLEESIKSKE